jgi:hypothetical protein
MTQPLQTSIEVLLRKAIDEHKTGSGAALPSAEDFVETVRLAVATVLVDTFHAGITTPNRHMHATRISPFVLRVVAVTHVCHVIINSCTSNTISITTINSSTKEGRSWLYRWMF